MGLQLGLALLGAGAAAGIGEIGGKAKKALTGGGKKQQTVTTPQVVTDSSETSSPILDKSRRRRSVAQTIQGGAIKRNKLAG